MPESWRSRWLLRECDRRSAFGGVGERTAKRGRAGEKLVRAQVTIGNEPDFVTIIREDEKSIGTFGERKSSEDAVGGDGIETVSERVWLRREIGLELLDPDVKAVLNVDHATEYTFLDSVQGDISENFPSGAARANIREHGRRDPGKRVSFCRTENCAKKTKYSIDRIRGRHILLVLRHAGRHVAVFFSLAQGRADSCQSKWTGRLLPCTGAESG